MGVRRRTAWMVLLAVLVLPATGCRGQARPEGPVFPERPAVTPDTAFAGLVARLSEPGGYFDTDNLISNEASYLHVAGALRARNLEGGVYLGVGPDQNFSYIALVRPRLAFIVDIRRDNLLQHLFFKALFTLARNRLEYLCLLTGRPLPPGGALPAGPPEAAGPDDLVAYVDATPFSPEVAAAARDAVRDLVPRFGVSLSRQDLNRIAAIQEAFFREGLDLRFTSHNRPPRPYYPTLRRLLLERDREGHQANFLAREDAFRLLKTMQAENRVIPVVGDLAGPHALRSIGAYLHAEGLQVSVFYTSNVAFYLMRAGTFGRFVANLETLPLHPGAVIIRSYFNRFDQQHPETVPGYASTQLLQPIGELIERYRRGEIRSYADLVRPRVPEPR
ncbi:hypothetical protein GQ464_006855 [Rhodocaloribacter litoris]|uniref:LIC_10091 family protein n=1 Tax=Rhodocaloribacter litoris TaxID=2558931 RepID=UPI001421C2C3|nr:hypothetical protein [Rhodocaloribacter litoris]QXD16651.1 hypothetical protein GQ464_006855 [Rhodocaloribacter litoris]